MKLYSNITILMFFLGGLVFGQRAPFFNTGEDPKPKDTKWKLVKNMSDEFKGKTINNKKWQYEGQNWKGRSPGLFLPENINVSDGFLKIKTTLLEKHVTKGGKTFTHGGGYVGSYKNNTYGYYECRMKANKTFMSSTFWLINEGRNEKGCDKRTTELDVQECVGRITSTKEFAKKMTNHMNSNTHSRNIPEGCDYPKDTKGAKAPLNTNAHEDFHVYGVWWKSKDEVQFFLDGKFQSKLKPASDFNIPMHLRMVVETYDWNPAPEDGGMTGTLEDRTTLYDWVRVWDLK